MNHSTERSALSGTQETSLSQPGARASRLRRRPLAQLWTRIAATDPGLLRFVLAARGTLAVGITTTALIMIASRTGHPITQFAFGPVFSMIAPFVMRDPTRRQRQTTLVFLLLAAACAVTVASLVHADPPSGELWFLVLVFACALLQTRHPRALGLGLIAVIMTYVGLYLGLPPATLPAQLGSLGVAAVGVVIACFVLIPLRPVATLQRAVAAVRRRASSVLREAATPDPRRPPVLRRHLAGLNAAALAAEDQLVLLNAPAQQDVRLHLFELEQAVAQLIKLVTDGAVPARHWDRLRVAGERLRRVPRSRPASPPGQPLALRDPVHAALLALDHASAGLERAASRAVVAASAPAATPPAPPGPLAWRSALQMTLASFVAMVGGMELSPQRWFWAVIAAYVVFLNTRSRGDTIYKGSHRVIGTFAGLFGGLAISTAVAHSGFAECVIMLAAVFGMYYFYAISYGVAIFCITVLLGMVYGSLGTTLEPLLLLRLEETAIGVVAAAIAASFVWPIQTRHQVRLSGQAVLRSLRDVVRTSLAAMASGPSQAPIEAVRRLDRQIADLRLALTPVSAGRFIMRRARAARPVTALLACAEAARVIAAAAARGSATAEDSAAFPAQATAIEQRIAAILEETPTPPAVPGQDYVPSGPVGEAFQRLDLALSMLAERLQANLVAGFAVD